MAYMMHCAVCAVCCISVERESNLLVISALRLTEFFYACQLLFSFATDPAYTGKELMILTVVEESHRSHTAMVGLSSKGVTTFRVMDRLERGREEFPRVRAVPRGHRGLANVSNETELSRAGLPSAGRFCLPPFSNLLSSSFPPSTASITWYRSHSHQVMTVKTVRGADTTTKIQTW
jgi:hypothetical protein